MDTLQLDGIRVCPKCWIDLLGASRTRYYALVRDIRDGYQAPSSSGKVKKERTEEMKTFIARAFIRELFHASADFDPVNNIAWLPPGSGNCNIM